MRTSAGPAVLLLTALLALVPIPAAAQELTVLAAISLQEAVDEIGRRFTRDHPEVGLRYQFGAAGELQARIEAGAPADVFISGALRQMDALERSGLILADSRRVIASNALVALKPPDSTVDVPGPSDLLDRRVQRIGIGDPRTVPAGQYAEESLRALGLWDRLQRKIVLGAHVRQVLDAVTRGEVDVGVVYATDGVLRLGRVRLAFAFPADTHRPILYPAAVVKASRAPAAARAFVEFLTSPEAQAILGRRGFERAASGGR
jgi:molybdate transport system substrate-binding protein